MAPAIAPKPGVQRGVVDHVIILDGTFSSLDAGQESNAGITFRLLKEKGVPGRRSVYYEPGLQWEGWRYAMALMQGRGINPQIRRAYGFLASHYRPGDRIYLLGYSRGAFAVRSLAGVIDRVGLLTREHATERAVRLAWRHYRTDPDRASARAFARRFCHDDAKVEMVGVWDTVKALGIRLPLLWMLTDQRTAFHNHQLGPAVKHGFQALALDETRDVFEPVLWETPTGWPGNIEQVWFRGAHADIGGQLGSFEVARPLANIPLVWMLERAEGCGLALPMGWHARFPCDATAPMVGTMKSWGKFFLLRHRRVVGRDPSERVDPTALVVPRRWWQARIQYAPNARPVVGGLPPAAE